jgi:hypothetical protein
MRVHRVENRQNNRKKGLKIEYSSKNESSIGLRLWLQGQLERSIGEK